MILPTYECNLRCWYCEQKRQNLWLGDFDYQKILDLWLNNAHRPDISQLHLSWFGGEPLMAFNQIEKLTSAAKSVADKVGKEFVCDITTNATLLTSDRIERLYRAGVSYYQITIDGSKIVHDKIKKLGSASAFDKTLKNVNYICRHSYCILRFNYTKDTLQPEEVITDILDRISPENRKNIGFTPMMVWQEKADNIDEGQIDKLFNLAYEAGLNPQPMRGDMCYADWANFDCIFPNGKVCKCDNSHPDSAKGEIIDGKVVWSGDCTSHIPVFETDNALCKNCAYFPICWGPCEPRREEMAKHKKFVCAYKDKDAIMRDRILRLYKSQKGK